LGILHIRGEKEGEERRKRKGRIGVRKREKRKRMGRKREKSVGLQVTFLATSLTVADVNGCCSNNSKGCGTSRPITSLLACSLFRAADGQR